MFNQSNYRYCKTFNNQIETYIKIVSSDLIVISSLNFKQLNGGGTVEISQNNIVFNPFLKSYDVDQIVDIQKLDLKYSCQIIDNGIQYGYPMSNNSQVNILSRENG